MGNARRTYSYVVALVFALMFSSSMAADKKSAKDTGPSAAETVDFLNGLLSCKVISKFSGPRPELPPKSWSSYTDVISTKATSLSINQKILS